MESHMYTYGWFMLMYEKEANTNYKVIILQLKISNIKKNGINLGKFIYAYRFRTRKDPTSSFI